MLIEKAVNEQNIDDIFNYLSSNARDGLKDEIDLNLRYSTVQYEQYIETYSSIENNQIKAEGSFAAKGIGWEISGLDSNFFIFEQSGEDWLLVDTDFHKKLSMDYAWSSMWNFMKKVLMILLPILFVIFVFWLWMLIDCIKRKFEDKTMWLLLIIFFGIIGAILYFFFVRRKLINQPNTSQNIS